MSETKRLTRDEAEKFLAAPRHIQHTYDIEFTNRLTRALLAMDTALEAAEKLEVAYSKGYFLGNPEMVRQMKEWLAEIKAARLEASQ
mgnify:CR=1 FL=1